jgi:hypothetical protein
MTDGVKEQIARTFRELGFTAKGCTKVYQKPYPEYFDTIRYPRGFQVPNFSEIIADDNKTTYEDVRTIHGTDK